MHDRTADRQGREILELFMEWDRVYEAYARAKGLSYLSLAVLECLYDHPEGITQKEISEGLHYPKQSVNLVIKGWAVAGLLEMEELASDRRNKAVRLTEQGKAYASEVAGPLRKADQEAFGSLPAEARSAFVESLKRYTENFSLETAKLL